MKLAIVVSDTYPEITGKMLDIVRGKADQKEVELKIVHVPGSFDIPFGVRKVIESVDGVVTLGAIIKGETGHDEIIGNAIAASLNMLSVDFEKPVSLGISGPGMTREQAIVRIEKMAGAFDACVRLVGDNSEI
jgi:6,7-dimethyl-8-ribityllumazine synthase